jgi:hypothetical protein
MRFAGVPYQWRRAWASALNRLFLTAAMSSSNQRCSECGGLFSVDKDGWEKHGASCQTQMMAQRQKQHQHEGKLPVVYTCLPTTTTESL